MKKEYFGNLIGKRVEKERNSCPIPHLVQFKYVINKTDSDYRAGFYCVSLHLHRSSNTCVLSNLLFRVAILRFLSFSITLMLDDITHIFRFSICSYINRDIKIYFFILKGYSPLFFIFFPQIKILTI